MLGPQDRQRAEQAAEEPARARPRATSRTSGCAETKADAEEAFDFFVRAYRAKYDKAVECLTKDRDRLLTFYDFPAEHWKHVRSTNPIESTFATVRLRTVKDQGMPAAQDGARHGVQAVVERPAKMAQARWLRPGLAEVIQHLLTKLKDGIKQIQNAA